MRLKNTFLFVAMSVVVGVGVTFSGSANATSSKYKRPSPTAETTTGANATPNPSASPSPDSKVDISGLENRYWTAKDTEFNVVQNRLYTKAKRFALTLEGGTDLSNPYTNDFNLGVNLNYYFSERQGIEINYWKSFASDANFVNQFAQANGFMPDHNLQQGYVGVNYNWIPIYAKISLLEKKILYFDMSLSPGIGMTFLKAEAFNSPGLPVPTANQAAPLTFALDVAQQVFIDEHWAIRVDLRNHIYNETIYQASSGNQLRQQTTYSGTIMFGVTYFK